MKINQFNQNVFETRFICFLFFLSFLGGGGGGVFLHLTTCMPWRAGVYRRYILYSNHSSIVEGVGGGGGLALKEKRTAIKRTTHTHPGKWQYIETSKKRKLTIYS